MKNFCREPLFAFFFFFHSTLYAGGFDPWSIISTDNDPSALVEGTVSAITGQWCPSVDDLVIQGVEPICSAPNMHRRRF